MGTEGKVSSLKRVFTFGSATELQSPLASNAARHRVPFTPGFMRCGANGVRRLLTRSGRGHRILSTFRRSSALPSVTSMRCQSRAKYRFSSLFFFRARVRVAVCIFVGVARAGFHSVIDCTEKFFSINLASCLLERFSFCVECTDNH
jgi:hypothetical protein